RPHFPRFADARLEDAQRMVRADGPHAQRYTHLAVPATRVAHNALAVPQQLVQPLLHHGLAVAAGDADHGQAELAAMPGRKGLQRLPRVLHLDHAQPAILRYLPALYQEAAGTPLAQRVDVAVPVVVLAAEGDEQGVLGMPRLA